MSCRGLPRPNPTQRVPRVSQARRHGPEAATAAGAAQGSTLGGKGAGAPNTLAGAQASPGGPAPRPLASASGLGSGPGRARPSSPRHRACYLAWGRGRGGGKGSGQMSPGVAAATAGAAAGEISAATRRLGLKRKNSVGKEGEERKAGQWKEEKTEAGEVSREVKSPRETALGSRDSQRPLGRPPLLALGTQSGRSLVGRKWRRWAAPCAGYKFIFSVPARSGEWWSFSFASGGCQPLPEVPGGRVRMCFLRRAVLGDGRNAA